MKHVKKSVLIWYSPHEMYTLVTAVEDYPRFLPWCERAEVLERPEAGVTARLHLAYLGVRQSFTTRNVHAAGSSVELQLVDGPFSELAGTWRSCPCPWATGRRPRPARSSSTCATPSPTRRSKRWSARCSTALPTPSSSPSSNAPSRCMGRAEVLSVTVACSPRAGVVDEVLLALPEGATVADALRESGMDTRHDTNGMAVECGDVLAEPGDRLRDRDRVELYRPLQVDPKEARRLRQQKQRGTLRR